MKTSNCENESKSLFLDLWFGSCNLLTFWFWIEDLSFNFCIKPLEPNPLLKNLIVARWRDGYMSMLIHNNHLTPKLRHEIITLKQNSKACCGTSPRFEKAKYAKIKWWSWGLIYILEDFNEGVELLSRLLFVNTNRDISIKSRQVG